MNYIELINQFWKIRRSKRLSQSQADVYYALMQESNEREWENPFEYSNIQICARLHMSEPTMIKARARLKQVGLIDFKAGERNIAAPVYKLIAAKDSSKKGKSNLKNFSNSESNMDSNMEGRTDSNKGNIINKLNKTETKDSVTNVTGASAGNENQDDLKDEQAQKKKSSAQKKKSDPAEVTPHWPAVVRAWFKFHEDQKLERPSFKDSDPADLKVIIDNLQKRAKDKGELLWTEQMAVDRFTSFLQFAYAKDWLKTEFLLHIIRRKFDSIINSNGQSNSKNRNGQGELNTDLKRNLVDRLAKVAGKV